MTAPLFMKWLCVALLANMAGASPALHTTHRVLRVSQSSRHSSTSTLDLGDEPVVGWGIKNSSTDVVSSLWPQFSGSLHSFLSQPIDDLQNNLTNHQHALDIVVDRRTNDEIRLRLFVFWINALISTTIWALLICIIACFYNRFREPIELVEGMDTKANHATFAQWKFGLFACLENPEVCFYGFCCPAIRWADTINLAGFLRFWPAFFVYVILLWLNAITGQVVLCVLLAMVCAHYRQKLRHMFQMDNQGCCGYLADCFMYLFCSCCLIVQEAQHIESAYRAGHPEVRQFMKEPLSRPKIESEDPFLLLPDDV